MRKATTIKPIMWNKPGFRSLSTNSRLVFLFLLTGPATSLSGMLSYSTETICACTGLSAPVVKKSMVELVSTGRIRWDESWGLVLLLRWIKHNPMNSKLIIGAHNEIRAYEFHEFHQIAEYLIDGGDPDTLPDTLSDRVYYTPQGQGQGSSPKIPKKKTPKKDDGSTEIAQAMADEWNKIFNTTRGPTTTLIKAIKAVLKAEGEVLAEDFALVVRTRAIEDWVIERKPPLESLIRVERFAGYLEKAKETHAKSPEKSEKLRMMEEIAKQQEDTND